MSFLPNYSRVIGSFRGLRDSPCQQRAPSQLKKPFVGEEEGARKQTRLDSSIPIYDCILYGEKWREKCTIKNPGEGALFGNYEKRAYRWDWGVYPNDKSHAEPILTNNWYEEENIGRVLLRMWSRVVHHRQVSLPELKPPFW